jgi:hypothetical protein
MTRIKWISTDILLDYLLLIINYFVSSDSFRIYQKKFVKIHLNPSNPCSSCNVHREFTVLSLAGSFKREHMNKLLFIITLLFTSFLSSAQDAQDSWKVKLNNKLLLATSREDERANRKTVKSSEWKKSGWLEIRYKEADPGFWKRYFLFNDEEDHQLLTKDSVTHAKIAIASLRKLFAGKKEIRIYTIVSPLDPNIAVRLRRVHLCTLHLQ